MTALTVMYAQRTRLPLAALTTTVPGNPPSLDPSATLRLSPPVATAQGVPAVSPQPPPDVQPRPLTIQAADLAIVTVEAEFDDPLEVFDWQVVITTAPDGTLHYHLDRLATARVGADLVTTVDGAKRLKLEVPRLGNLDKLQFEVYDTVGLVRSGVLRFSSTDPAEATLAVPGQSPPVVLVEGYPLVVARAVGNGPD